MPGDFGRFVIHSEISFLRLSVGVRSEPFLRFAGSHHLLPRGFDGGLSFVGRKCRVRPPIVTIKKLHIQNRYRKLANASRGRKCGDSGRARKTSRTLS